MDTATNPVQLSHVQETASVKQALQAALRDVISTLKRWFVPHLLAGIGVFLLVAYVTSFVLFSSWKFPFNWVGMCMLLALYGAVAFGYSLFTTCVFAVRVACVRWSEFIEELLDLVQERTVGQVAGMNVGLSKHEAKTVVRGSVREVFTSFQTQQRGLSRGLILLILGVTSAALRAVLFSKISRWSGKTIQLGKLFTGKATLAGAVFLNLHFFSTLLLGVCYAVGALVLAINIYFVFLLK